MSLADVIAFPRYVFRRFQADDGLRAASALSYATALALVPLIAIGLALFAAFPAFDDIRVEMVLFVFANLSPDLGPQIQGAIQSFVDNAGGLTGFGAVGLAATAVLLLNNIEKIFSKIWRAETPASLLRRAPVYWAALTLGPLLMGASVSLSSDLPSLLGGVERFAPPGFFQNAGAIVMMSVGFFLLYKLMPQAQVAARDAAAGALFAALAFTAARQLFALYLALFPTYEAIYGALAALPAMLIWIYLSWVIVVLGAEIAAALPEWRAGAGETRDPPRGGGRGRRISAALNIIERLQAASAFGAQADDAALAAATRLEDVDIAGEVTSALADAGVIGRLESGGWALLRDPDLLTLEEVMRALNLDLGAIAEGPIAKLRAAERPVANAPVGDLLRAR